MRGLKPHHAAKVKAGARFDPDPRRIRPAPSCAAQMDNLFHEGAFRNGFVAATIVSRRRHDEHFEDR
jgi:hypothetical protein